MPTWCWSANNPGTRKIWRHALSRGRQAASSTAAWKKPVDRTRCYVTNAVKHFKFAPRGKRRIHSKPNVGETKACAWWLATELRLVEPPLVVALGATALYSLLGKDAKVTRDRGQIITGTEFPVLVTIHPSALLRTMNRPGAAQDRQRFIADLRRIAKYIR